MENAEPGANTDSQLAKLSLAIDIILPSESLAELCKRAVIMPGLKNTFDGAHVLLNTHGKLNYDCGYGLSLPVAHLELANDSITFQKIQFASEKNDHRAMVAIPFIQNEVVEAVGILLLHPGAQNSYIDADLEPTLKKLTGFYLANKVGLDY